MALTDRPTHAAVRELGQLMVGLRRFVSRNLCGQAWRYDALVEIEHTVVRDLKRFARQSIPTQQPFAKLFASMFPHGLDTSHEPLPSSPIPAFERHIDHA